MDDSLLLPSEVAAILRTKTVTVYSAAKDGRIPSVTIWKGRRRPLIRFRREDIEALVRGKKTE